MLHTTFFPIREFIKLDFPTFGWPIVPIVNTCCSPSLPWVSGKSSESGREQPEAFSIFFSHGSNSIEFKRSEDLASCWHLSKIDLIGIVQLNTILVFTTSITFIIPCTFCNHRNPSSQSSEFEARFCRCQTRAQVVAWARWKEYHT